MKYSEPSMKAKFQSATLQPTHEKVVGGATADYVYNAGGIILDEYISAAARVRE